MPTAMNSSSFKAAIDILIKAGITQLKIEGGPNNSFVITFSTGKFTCVLNKDGDLWNIGAVLDKTKINLLDI